MPTGPAALLVLTARGRTFLRPHPHGPLSGVCGSPFQQREDFACVPTWGRALGAETFAPRTTVCPGPGAAWEHLMGGRPRDQGALVPQERPPGNARGRCPLPYMVPPGLGPSCPRTCNPHGAAVPHPLWRVTGCPQCLGPRLSLPASPPCTHPLGAFPRLLITQRVPGSGTAWQAGRVLTLLTFTPQWGCKSAQGVSQ